VAATTQAPMALLPVAPCATNCRLCGCRAAAGGEGLGSLPLAKLSPLKGVPALGFRSIAVQPGGEYKHRPGNPCAGERNGFAPSATLPGAFSHRGNSVFT